MANKKTAKPTPLSGYIPKAGPKSSRDGVGKRMGKGNNNQDARWAAANRPNRRPHQVGRASSAPVQTRSPQTPEWVLQLQSNMKEVLTATGTKLGWDNSTMELALEYGQNLATNFCKCGKTRADCKCAAPICKPSSGLNDTVAREVRKRFALGCLLLNVCCGETIGERQKWFPKFFKEAQHFRETRWRTPRPQAS